MWGKNYWMKRAQQPGLLPGEVLRYYESAYLPEPNNASRV